VPSIIVAAIYIVAGLSIFYLVRGEPLLVQGEVDATRLDIAARVDGRVAEIPVERGEDVAANAVLVRIDNPGQSPRTSRRWRPRSWPKGNSPTSTSAPALR
jgi:HlyD family secretion protein